MADVRALLRQQRAARRIDDPYAAYSPTGKLSCSLCRQPVKAESLWHGHLESQGHQQRLRDKALAPDPHTKEALSVQPKRKLNLPPDGPDMEDSTRRKRSRPDEALSDTTALSAELPQRSGTSTQPESKAPSDLPGALTTGSPQATISMGSLPMRQSSSRSTPAGTATPTPTAAAPAAEVDEAEWAAFEAEVAADMAPYAEEAVITASAMTAEESAAAAAASKASGKDELTGKAKADVEMEDEREEAQRAMETEFDEMHQLEVRLKQLKEKRESLRVKSAPGQPGAGSKSTALESPVAPPDSKSNAVNGSQADGEEKDEEEEGNDDDDDEDEDEDDWDAFRFRAP